MTADLLTRCREAVRAAKPCDQHTAYSAPLLATCDACADAVIRAVHSVYVVESDRLRRQVSKLLGLTPSKLEQLHAAVRRKLVVLDATQEEFAEIQARMSRRIEAADAEVERLRSLLARLPHLAEPDEMAIVIDAQLSTHQRAECARLGGACAVTREEGQGGSAPPEGQASE